MVKSWDFHRRHTYQNFFFVFFVSVSSLTLSNSRVTNAKLCGHCRALECRRWETHWNHVFPLLTLWPGEVSKIPCTSPKRLPPSIESPGPLNASHQTRFSTSRAKPLPYPISHQTLMDLMWESIITPVPFCGFALFFLRPCRLSWIYSVCLQGPSSNPV